MEELFFQHLAMRLLICIQAVDLDDGLMGFFHQWLEEAAKHFSLITVLALRVGRYDLPSNIRVIPLRPKASHSRLMVIQKLIHEAWIRRREYDAVFVRGDPHYVILASWLWRMLGKRVVFWYAHYKVSNAAVLASAFAHVTVASVKASYDHPWVRPVFIGQNIHRANFPLREVPRSSVLRCLVFGRIAPAKRLEEVIDAFLASHGETGATLTIGGPVSDPFYAEQIQLKIKDHPSIIWDAGSIPYDQLATYLAQFDVLINAYPGSLDKTIVESAMTGLVTIAATDGMSEWLAPEDLWLMAKTIDERSRALKRLYNLSFEERLALVHRLRERAIEHHSLDKQIQKLIPLLQP